MSNLVEIVRRARYILSILPPSSAATFAQEIRERLDKLPASNGTDSKNDSKTGDRPPGSPLIFADCNAVSPETVQQIATYFTEDTFVDGSIIGGPPSEPGITPPYDPTFYVSGKADIVKDFAELLTKGGLKVGVLPAKIGEASALKMGYAVRIFC